jgi:hypothetical protein
MSGVWSKCSMCGLEFSGVSNFDAHLSEKYTANGGFTISCSPPESIGMGKNEHGYWANPNKIVFDLNKPSQNQILECSKCHKMWEREPKRGRTPKFCPKCAPSAR